AASPRRRRAAARRERPAPASFCAFLVPGASRGISRAAFGHPIHCSIVRSTGMCRGQRNRDAGGVFMSRIVAAFAALLGLMLPAGDARAEATTLRVAKQFGSAYMQFFIMQDQKMIEKHAKQAGLGDVSIDWATFRSSDVMNDALISGSVDFVCLGIPGIVTIWSKTKGTAIEVKGATGFNVSPLMLLVRDPAIKSLKDFKEGHKIALPAIKVSMQAVILQIAAAKELGAEKFNALDHLTVSMAHPDATAAMLGGPSEVVANFSS